VAELRVSARVVQQAGAGSIQHKQLGKLKQANAAERVK